MRKLSGIKASAVLDSVRERRRLSAIHIVLLFLRGRFRLRLHIKLVEENGGFAFYQAYRDDVDHILGGKDGTYWYFIMKNGKVAESYIGKDTNGAWEDICVKGSGARQKTKAMPSGSTIRRIAEKAYLMQNEPWVTRRTPKPIEDAHPHYHYVYGFGDKGLDASVQYGVTIAYSDIKDADAGFPLRYLYTGNDVALP